MTDSLVYNDYVGTTKREQKALLKKGDIEAIDYDTFYSDIFFTLANTKHIGYRVSKSDVVYVQQNVNATDTTGGIVWESAYLLLDYLLKSTHQRCSVTADDTTSERYTVIDLGAGTGLLGLALSRFRNHVTVTEYSDTEREHNAQSQAPSNVYELLQTNVMTHNEKTKLENESKPIMEQHNPVNIFPLDWSEGARDINNWTHDPNNTTTSSFSSIKSSKNNCIEYDLVLGTDVLFSPSLVRPLLRTASLLTKSATGTCLFCMQIRCQDSHQTFLDIVNEYFDSCCDISETVYDTVGCAWGRFVECLVFEMKGGKQRNNANTEEFSSASVDSKKRKSVDACDNNVSDVGCKAKKTNGKKV